MSPLDVVDREHDLNLNQIHSQGQPGIALWFEVGAQQTTDGTDKLIAIKRQFQDE